jgi:hypothetical protein
MIERWLKDNPHYMSLDYSTTQVHDAMIEAGYDVGRTSVYNVRKDIQPNGHS